MSCSELYKLLASKASSIKPCFINHKRHCVLVTLSREKKLGKTELNRGFLLPDKSIGSFSSVFLTWSDSPVSELSSIFRSLPWRRTPSAGKRSPKKAHRKRVSFGETTAYNTFQIKAYYFEVISCDTKKKNPNYHILLVLCHQQRSQPRGFG